MSDKHQIRNGIIIGVSVLAIGAVATWIFPSVKAISKSVLAFVVGAITEAASFVFGLLGTPIPLWVWLLGFGISVVVISIKRRWVVILTNQRTEMAKERVKKATVMAKEAEENRIATRESIKERTKQIFEPKEPELDKIFSVESEEYDDEEEEEEGWRSYTSDNILDIDWQWRWHGESIESLTPICPNCELELSAIARPFDDTGYDNREWLLGFKCQDEECDFEHDPHHDSAAHEYYELIKKHIRREARNRGWPV